MRTREELAPSHTTDNLASSVHPPALSHSRIAPLSSYLDVAVDVDSPPEEPPPDWSVLCVDVDDDVDVVVVLPLPLELRVNEEDVEKEEAPSPDE